MLGRLFGDFTIEVSDRVWEAKLQWDDGIVRHPATVEFFYRRLMEIEKPNPIILDIGACVGNYSMLAKFRSDAKFYAFEPNPAVFSLLVEQIRLNGLAGRVIPFPCGLFNRKGWKTLAAHPRLTRAGSATFGEHPHKDEWDKIQVPVRRLNSFVHLWPNGVDLVKLDVEGAELYVLRGGRKVFKAQKPPLLLEYVKSNCKLFGYDRECLKKTLFSWGYKKFEKVGGIDRWATT